MPPKTEPGKKNWTTRSDITLLDKADAVAQQMRWSRADLTNFALELVVEMGADGIAAKMAQRAKKEPAKGKR